jgi:hypothetical protein
LVFSSGGVLEIKEQTDAWFCGHLADWRELDRTRQLNQGVRIVNGPVEQAQGMDFGALVFDETIRRSLRQSPQTRLEMLCAALRDAEARGMIPKRDRAAHEKRLLWLIQRASSKS